jgi:hypothetical protein
LPGSPPSFSAWRLCSPSSCCPLGERGRQDEQITGDTMKRPGCRASATLPLAPDARRVLRLEPQLRWPAPIWNG